MGGGQRSSSSKILRQNHDVRRLLLYSGAVVVAGLRGMVAWVSPDSRLAFITIAGAFGGGLWWTARRFPEVQRIHLLGAAIAAMFGGLVVAIVLPTTRVLCDCPPPPGAVGGATCNCPLDHHISLRIAIAIAGVVVAGAFCLAGTWHGSRQLEAEVSAGSRV
jgi:hypothetical protein